MATGTGNLPNPGLSFSPFAILTAEEQNNLVENIESLADGTGIGDGSIGTSDIANGSVIAIKTSFGGNYTTSEVNTGFTWVNGNTIYKKTINFGALPNTTTKSVAHGVTGLTYLVDISGVSMNASSVARVLPYSSTTLNQNIQLLLNGANIDIFAAVDLTTYITTYITMYYTK